MLLTTIQRAVRQYHNPNFTISFDCASPFLATANGQVYYGTRTTDRSKWSDHMEATVDDKKYATDGRSFRDAVIQDGIHKQFEDSPVSSRLKVSDICCYKPGDLNKIGKEGKTSWDSFSYALLMGHNVWTHIEAVQRANRAFDSGIFPGTLAHEHDRCYDAAAVIESVFAARDRQRSMAIIDNHPKVWERIIGTRGFTGKRTVNATHMFDQLFESDEPVSEESDPGSEQLDALENSV